jgi:hypothetical protein
VEPKPFPVSQQLSEFVECMARFDTRFASILYGFEYLRIEFGYAII